MTEQHPPEFHKALNIEPDDTRTPVEVLRDFTKSWVDGMQSWLDELNGLMAKAEAMVQARRDEDDLCRWGDEGGFCP